MGDTMKKYLGITLILLLFVVGCGSKNIEKEDNKEEEPEKEEQVEYLTGLHHVEMEIVDYGVISLELDADSAPITVTNFMNLAKEGFYDGLTFHRIINGFMMQGGASSEKKVKTIKGEFKENGVSNPLEHVRGVISMARNGYYDGASSQFFIVQRDSHHLDGLYAAFGHVTDGMDIVDQICANVQVEDDNGTVLLENQPVIKTIRVID